MFLLFILSKTLFFFLTNKQTWEDVLGLCVVWMYPSVSLLDDTLEHYPLSNCSHLIRKKSHPTMTERKLTYKYNNTTDTGLRCTWILNIIGLCVCVCVCWSRYVLVLVYTSVCWFRPRTGCLDRFRGWSSRSCERGEKNGVECVWSSLFWALALPPNRIPLFPNGMRGELH